MEAFPASSSDGVSAADSQDERSDLVEALALVAAGKVKPILETYPITKVNEVRERLKQGKVRCRAVLRHA